MIVEIAYAGTSWLVKEILKEAGDAVVLEPEEAREAVRSAIADLASSEKPQKRVPGGSRTAAARRKPAAKKPAAKASSPTDKPAAKTPRTPTAKKQPATR